MARHIPILFAISVLILLGALSSSSAWAQSTLLVPQQYPTIQQAIVVAVDGDTVLVDDGTYPESIDFLGKGITVTSVNGPGSSTIDANFTGSVVTFVNCGADSALSGFTITHGSGTFFGNNFRGGGIFCQSSTPTITGNVISSNSLPISVGGWGGGMYCFSSAPTLTGNTFQGNFSRGGGGCFMDGSNGIVTGNTFLANTANNNGGGLTCSASSPLVSGNDFIDNTTVLFNGGGMTVSSLSSPEISDNHFFGNAAEFLGGAINCGNSTPTITHNTFDGNSANGGGGINFNGSSGTVTDNLFQNNITSPGGGAGLICQGNSLPTISGNAFKDNVADGVGGGIGCWNGGSPIISNNIFLGNSSGFGGGVAVYLLSSHSDPTIRDNLFNENSSSLGAGIYCDTNSVTITGNEITGNTAVSTGLGGGLYLFSTLAASVSGNTLYANSALAQGGGVFMQNCSIDFTNNTLHANSAAAGGGMQVTQDAGSTVTNTIAWGNTATTGTEINVIGADPEVDSCCVAGGMPGAGNIDADPLFADPGNGDLHLLDGSPCINAGTNSAPGLLPTDCDGESRIICVIVDIGCDEAPAPTGGCSPVFMRADVNQDGLLDIADPIGALNILFSGAAPSTCDDSTDANDDGAFDLGDAVYTLGALFVFGDPPPLPPFPGCGPDPSPDALGCVDYDTGACP